VSYAWSRSGSCRNYSQHIREQNSCRDLSPFLPFGLVGEEKAMCSGRFFGINYAPERDTSLDLSSKTIKALLIPAFRWGRMAEQEGMAA
jgi:hypothetical protein